MMADDDSAAVGPAAARRPRTVGDAAAKDRFWGGWRVQNVYTDRVREVKAVAAACHVTAAPSPPALRHLLKGERGVKQIDSPGNG